MDDCHSVSPTRISALDEQYSICPSFPEYPSGSKRHLALPMKSDSTDTSPNFIGIGAQKAGTTWLYSQLSKHPSVWMPPIKELHYFDRSPKYSSPNGLNAVSPFTRIWRNDPFYQRQRRRIVQSLPKYIVSKNFDMIRWCARWIFGYYDDRWYKSLFEDKPPGTISGEITPAYSILTRQDIEWMNRINPLLKIILFVRNPIERAWSALRFYKKIGRFKNDINCPNAVLATLAKEEYTNRGDYMNTIENYLSVFDSSRFLICFYDSIEEKPEELLEKIYSFLEIPSIMSDREQLSTRHNASPPHQMHQEVRAYLIDTNISSIEIMAQRYGGYFDAWHQNLLGESPISPKSTTFPAAINP